MRILFLQKRILFPPDCGGKIRTKNVLHYLARWHDITYLCNSQSGDDEHLDAMRQLGVRLETVPWRETPRDSVRFYGELFCNLFSRYPYNVDKDYDVSLRRRAAALLGEEQYDLVICDFVQMARNAIGLKAPASLLFQHNVEAQIFERHAQSDRNWARRAYMGIQARKMRRFEAQAGKQFDWVVAVSEQDRAKFAADYGWNHVSVIDTAVDVEAFQPAASAEQPDRLVFVGSLDWLPNQDGVRHFVERIWPAIRSSRPQASFQIVGRNPTADIRDLAQVPGVEVVGTVPDVRPYLAAAAIVIVPLLVGGGTRLKIYEAMAMQKAVVSTSLGAEGLSLNPGEHIRLADAAEDFAAQVVELLENPKQRQLLAQRARQHVVRNYAAEVVARQFERICIETVAAEALPAASVPAAHADA